jgi:hypothetical protein
MNFYKSSINIFEVVNAVDDGDILSGVFWDIDGTDKIHEIILSEFQEGKRDKVTVGINYVFIFELMFIFYIFSFIFL